MASKGLPKSIIKKYGISKKAWRVFRGKKSKSSNPRRKKSGKVKRKVARRRYSRKRRRRSGGMTIPMAPIAGLAAGVAVPIQRITEGDWQNGLNILSENYTGYNFLSGEWQPEKMKRGVLPLVVGALVHKYVGGPPLNINRMLAAAKVPFIRI